MLNFVESKLDTSSDWESENLTFTKLIKDSSLYIQIFSDLLHFLANQEPSELASQFLVQATQLFELYLFKASNDFTILIKSLDFIMSRIQTINHQLLQEKQPSLKREVEYLLNFSQVVLYFIQESIQGIIKQDILTNSSIQGVSPHIRNKMSIKVIKNKNTQSMVDQIPNILKLKNDYVVYLM